MAGGSGCWSVTPTISWSLCPTRDRAEEARRRVGGGARRRSGCGCIPTRPGSCTSRDGAGGLRLLGLPSSEGGVRGSGEVAGTCTKWPSPRAMASIRGKVRERTDRRYAGLRPGGRRRRDLNPVLRGWGAYFRYGNSTRKFGAIDSYVHERLARLASSKHGLSGINWGSRFTCDWLGNLGIYRAHRNGALPTCACLTMNDVGEPCAGEPHARFDRGPLATAATPDRGRTRKPRAQRLRPAPTDQASGLPHWVTLSPHQPRERSGPSLTGPQRQVRSRADWRRGPR